MEEGEGGEDDIEGTPTFENLTKKCAIIFLSLDFLTGVESTFEEQDMDVGHRGLNITHCLFLIKFSAQ